MTEGRMNDNKRKSLKPAKMNGSKIFSPFVKTILNVRSRKEEIKREQKRESYKGFKMEEKKE